MMSNSLNKGEINIFKFLKIQHNENISSQFIVSIMKRNKEYLKLFLKKIKAIDFINYEKCKISTERTLKTKKKKSNYGRADIWIGSEEGKSKRIIIENKIFADDQQNQLKRYRQYLDEENSNREGYLYYLTLQGKPANKNSSRANRSTIMNEGNPKTAYKSISYSSVVIPWLKEVREITDSELLSVLIDNYLEIIEKLTKVVDEFEKNTTISELADGLSKNEFKTLSELQFWIKLENLILEKFSKVGISLHRKYSYKKIHKQQRNKKYGRSYGIIFNNTRIQLIKDNKKKKLELKISKGDFCKNSNRWSVTKELTNIPVRLNNLTSKNDSNNLANEVFETLLKYKKEIL